MYCASSVINRKENNIENKFVSKSKNVTDSKQATWEKELKEMERTLS